VTTAAAPPVRDMPGHLYWSALAGILLLAAALRFRDLAAAPIWMDEAFTIFAAQMPVGPLLFDAIDGHPPLFYLIQKLWMLLSDDPALARVPAAVFGSIGPVLLALAAGDLVSRRAGLVAGLLLALSTGHIFLSQDARMYSLLVVELIAATWGLLGWLGGGGTLRRRTYGILYVAGAAAALFTQIFAGAYLAALNLGGLAFVLARRGAGGRELLGINLVLVVPAIPFALHVARLLQGMVAP
jgi:uncharacterized membrane protein